jgi:hypothetical protein
VVAAPLSDDELADRAELIIEGVTKTAEGSFATVSVTKVIKGKLRDEGKRHFSWLGGPPAIRVYVHILHGHEKLGAWSNEGAFVAGKKLRAHLGWDTKMLSYDAVWWNAVKRI